jgi:hypothetical protein
MGSLILASYVLRAGQDAARLYSEGEIRSYYRRAASRTSAPAVVIAIIAGIGVAAGLLAG